MQPRSGAHVRKALGSRLLKVSEHSTKVVLQLHFVLEPLNHLINLNVLEIAKLTSLKIKQIFQLHALVKVVAFKPCSIKTKGKTKRFNYRVCDIKFRYKC